MRAGQRAGIMELVESLPDSWNTVLSKKFEGGTDLSGGQWQRVALARAMFALECGAGILVLDEPTASLDVRAESALYERFLDLTAGLTTIVVSHRFSTVRRADKIVVLEGGRIVEAGSHAQLMALDGRYARMFDLQARYYAESPEFAPPRPAKRPTMPAKASEPAKATKAAASKAAASKAAASKAVASKAVASKAAANSKAIAASKAAIAAPKPAEAPMPKPVKAVKPKAVKPKMVKTVKEPVTVPAAPDTHATDWDEWELEYPE
jgi:ABC-type glutathione transport system ATPase component